jgi:Sulfotransferase family
MQPTPAKPVFVVGSPRSGTSILTWCLGHHPNLFPVPESNWMGDFAVNVAIAYQIGAARGDYSILSAMDIAEDELRAALGQSINDLILRHRKHLETKREIRCAELKLDRRWLEASSTAAGPKTRWVDGTPEYSLHIYGLRKLFPQARFVHLFRDVEAVVRSMVNFHRVTGIQLVANEEDAYRYWTRTVSACLMAERAYGPTVVHRIHYTDLINRAELTMRSLLEFLGEPDTEKCLEPLELRINSSTVPADFQINHAALNPTLVDEATQLSAEVEKTRQQAHASPAAADEMEAAFRELVKHLATRDSASQNARKTLESLNKSMPPSQPTTDAALHSADSTIAVLPPQL